MVAFTGLFLSALLLLGALPPLGASPVPQDISSAGMRQQGHGVIAELLSFICNIKPLNVFLCGGKPPGSNNRVSFTISTPLGSASGVADTNGAVRFAVRYATAQRWQDPVMASKWEFPNNATDPFAMPLACPQEPNALLSTNTSEDCLSMILYVPVVAAMMRVPTMMWIHGGSFVVGSATAPGLDGASLAQATGSIVAVVQYRLAAFGFLAPSGQSNLAVKDMVTALQFLQKVLPSFNGDTGKITIAGQSSGATMVRALLATPSASNLFRSASLHSDPMNYGFLTNGAFQNLNNNFKSKLPCDSSDTSCLNNISTNDVLRISTDIFNSAPSIDASAGAATPLRPVTDGSLITSPLDTTANFPRQFKSIVVSTVQNEAGPTIYRMFTTPVPSSSFPLVVAASLGPDRSAKVCNSSHYALPASTSSTFDARTTLETLGTDQVWRCPSWTFARSWAAAGGKVYVGKYAVGVTYPDNSDVAFCKENGKVCHEDDIQVVFGTALSPSQDQRRLARQVQTRLKSFLAKGSPNAFGLKNWKTVSGSDVNALMLGGNGGKVEDGACDPGFWGQDVQYDYQVFND